jgi:23S rRNA (guanine2445-N2)-methyltransferase / 23S rRNA (guanine2069-N7)-methyltransferase
MSTQQQQLPLELIAVTAFGLGAVVVRELRDLGYDPQVVGVGRVLFQGDANAICRANLWLRAADRVLLRIGNFAATDFGQLFDGTRDLPWHRWLAADAEFPVSGRSIKSQLSSVPACQKIVKKAIVESLRAAHGITELVESGPRYSVEVALLKDEATLTIDTSGPGLHKRGYGRAVGVAPLKETLAAAIVMLSYWRAGRPLIDPFCGSGTIPIEAALWGRSIAPGLHRQFAAEAWPGVPSELWEEGRADAGRKIQPRLETRILAYDASEKAISLARHHAENAGVADDIHFQQKDFSELTNRRQYGCVICNPPYGIRVGEQADVRDLYASLPLVLRRLPTWSHYVLSAHPRLEQLVGRRADRRRKLYNGRIECTLYQFYGPKPERAKRAGGTAESDSPVVESAEGSDSAVPRKSAGGAGVTATPGTAPAFGGLTEKGLEQAELFRRRLTKQARHLRRWPTRRGITCFRLYDRDIPEIPLVVDRYEDHLHIAEYERPHDRDPAQQADWLDLMVRTAGETLDIPHGNVHVKLRQRQRGSAQYERQGSEGQTLIANEGGLKFHVNLDDYVDTGLFLDHRTTRQMVRELANGTRFLNLFAYTGAFSVYAAAGGAEQTTTVDWSNTYLKWARANMSLNGFSDDRHQFVQADALQYLQSLPECPLFDLAVVDPPTYSNSKRSDDDWDVQRDYAALLAELLIRMPAGATVFFSTNYRRFKFDQTAVAAANAREISSQTVPEDFRNRRIHRCWRLVRVDEPS